MSEKPESQVVGEAGRAASPAADDAKLSIFNGDAKEAIKKEHCLTFWQAIRLYPKAVGWSLFLSTAVAMEGYDIVLIASFFAFPPFRQQFGDRLSNGSYQVSAAWQSGLSNGARVGEIIGLIINGWVSERYGYRKTMMGFLITMIAFIFIPFFAKNIVTLQVGTILLGLPWGVFQTLTTTYAAEVCPMALRGYLTTYVNMMWGVGQLVASGVLRGFLQRSDEWAYRIPYALQWMWPVPLLVGAAFAPESPWWLVRRNRAEDARKALTRLTSNADAVELDQTVELMRRTNELERSISVGTSFWDCFKGVNLRRTEISCFAWAVQPLCGASLMGFAAYFFEQAGLSTDVAFDFSMGIYSMSIVGVVIAWFTMTYLGRRTLFLAGLSAMCLILLIIGFVSLAPSQTAGPNFAIGSLLLVWAFCYAVTVGTMTYSIVTEIPSNRLRTKTVVLGRSLYNVIGIINGVITPRMLNPRAWNWKGKAGFFWAGMCAICLTWSFWRLPETKGRTYAELDVLFANGVSARKFKKTDAEILEAHVVTEQNVKGSE
ncbi:Maltose permease MAL31 [Pseudocercospora fuligena]|uniref:Maltose permease MAL31 n=1 Tax=Pseudocercospora fuligena TaxID=685502 RepID=A0A8H6RRI3_9PEZI|nr:Maltose permease MAL31 [Pseudocercospora fuligena]